MNMCANHAEKTAVAYCRSCGKPLCELCRVEEYGAVYCSEHAPAALAAQAAQPKASGFTAPHPAGFPAGINDAVPPPPLPKSGYAPPSSPYAASPYDRPSGPSPAVATILGFIPGVGAIYNGQYAKGLIHAVVFGLFVTVLNSGVGDLEPLVAILFAAWIFYMVIEAYHTAKKKRAGLPVDEFSSIVSFRGVNAGMPLGAIVLIGLGILLLLNTTGLIPVERIMRYWPAGLILLGVYMLYARVEHRTSATTVHPAVQELTDERQ
jgi:hypothetical protein